MGNRKSGPAKSSDSIPRRSASVKNQGRRLILNKGNHPTSRKKKSGKPESNYFELYDLAPVSHFMLNQKGIIKEVNLAGARLLDVKKSLLLNKPFPRFVLSEFRDVFRSHFEKVFSTCTKQTCELKLMKKDGAPLYVLLESIAMTDEKGNLTLCLCAVSDITERKIVEEELMRYRLHLEEIVEERTAEMKKEITQRMQAEKELEHFASFPRSNPNPVLEVDSSGKIIFRNNATNEALKKLPLTDANVFLPDDINDMLKDLNQNIERQFYREIIIKDKTFGEILHLAPQFNAVRIYAIDITERKQAEELLQKSLEESRQRHLEFMALLEGSQAVLKYQDFKSAAQSIFNSCKNLIGATAGYIALLSKDGKENEVVFLDSGGLDCTVDYNLPMPIRGLRAEVYNNNRAAYHNDFFSSEWMKFMPTGHVRLHNVLFAPMIIGEKVIGLLGIANKPGGFDENDARIATAFAELASIALVQKRAEEVLRHNEEYFRLLIENASDVITILEADGTIWYESPSVEHVLGYKREDLIGRNAFEIVHPDDLQDVVKIFTHLSKNPGSTVFIQLRCQHKDGSWPIFEVTGSNLLNNPTVAGIVLNSRNITGRKKMEDEIRKSRDELEIRVHERTEELAKVNEELQNKITDLNLARNTLIEQSSQLEAFFGHTINPLVFLDKDFNFIRVNEAYARACQHDVPEFIGHNHFEFYPNEENEAIFSEVVHTKLPYQAYAKPFTFPDHPEWGVTYWDWTLTPILDGNGEVKFLVFALNDVTERKKAEDALQKSEASLAEAQRIATLGNWDWNIITDELSWSDEIYHIFGLIPRQFGSTFESFLNSIHPEDREFVKSTVNKSLHEKKPYNIDHRIILPGGITKIVHEQAKVEFDENGKPVRMIGTVQDITERKKIEDDLRNSREQLRNLYANLQSIREEERTHIAREIHDEFGTILTALKIDLSWLEKKLPEDKSIIERTKKDIELINSAIKTVQRIASELRPGILDHLGLSAAVEWQVKEFGNRTGIKWDISINIEKVTHEQDMSTAIFRILQETLTNIARHAEATKVSVCLNERDNLLVLEVKDDGKGVTEEQISNARSFGLMGIRERTQYWGGDVAIQGIPNKGTTVTISIPLENKEALNDKDTHR